LGFPAQSLNTPHGAVDLTKQLFFNKIHLIYIFKESPITMTRGCASPSASEDESRQARRF
jgi:hypothetical protein